MRFIKHALGRTPCSRTAEKRARLLIPDIRSFQSDPPSHCFFSLFFSWCYYFFHPRFFSLLSRARIAKFDTKTHQVSLLNSFLSFLFFFFVTTTTKMTPTHVFRYFRLMSISLSFSLGSRERAYFSPRLNLHSTSAALPFPREHFL